MPHTISGVAEVLISLGSNCGDRQGAVTAAFRRISALLDDARWSGLYETDSISGDGKRYINAVVKGHTRLSPEELERTAKHYELEAGRDREARLRGDVPLDIDLIIHGAIVLRPRDLDHSYLRQGLALLT